MEYLEGETLAERLEKGALPLDQALQMAIEIADALDKARWRGGSMVLRWVAAGVLEAAKGFRRVKSVSS